MKSIYNQIDNIFDNSQNSGDKILLDDILNQLKEIKELLKTNNKPITPKESISEDFYQFIKDFRKSLKADINKDIYPEVEYKGRKFGVNNRGLLYDKDTTRFISKQEAFKIYRYFYKNREK